MFGRREGWEGGRWERLSIPIFSMNTYIYPRVKYYKMCPNIKALGHLTKGGRRHSKIHTDKISIYQIKRNKKTKMGHLECLSSISGPRTVEEGLALINTSNVAQIDTIQRVQ